MYRRSARSRRGSGASLAEIDAQQSPLCGLNDAGKSRLRSQLAEQITSPRTTQFAKAFVNRVWAELLGRGIVEPVDDFSEHNPASHPETLEALAKEFIAHGYDAR